MSSNKKLSVNDRQFFWENSLNILNRGVANRITFFGFFITINIAIFALIYSQKIDSIKILNVPVKDFLNYFILSFNILISFIYYREHNISEIHESEINQYFDSFNELMELKRHMLIKDYFNFRITWIIMRLFFSSAIIFPLCLIYDVNLYSVNYFYLIALFLIFFLGVHYYIFCLFIFLIRLLKMLIVTEKAQNLLLCFRDAFMNLKLCLYQKEEQTRKHLKK